MAWSHPIFPAPVFTSRPPAPHQEELTCSDYGDAIRPPPQNDRSRLRLEWLEERWTPAVVNTFQDTIDNDPNVTSLREAIIAANDPMATDRTIVFDTTINGSLIILNKMLPELDQNIEIDGRNADISIHRNEELQPFRLMQVKQNVTATIRGLTFGHGEAPAGESGGAIRSYGNLELDSCTFDYNSATFAQGAGGLGGAVHIPAASGTLDVVNCAFNFNHAYRGGAISIVSPSASSWITNSSFTGNSAEDWGGAILILGDSTSPKLFGVSSTLLTDNTAGNRGGAIYADNANLVLNGGTDINYNFTTGVSGEGGGVYITGDGSITYDDVSIGDNDAATGDGVWRANTVTRYNGPGNVNFYSGDQEYLQP